MPAAKNNNTPGVASRTFEGARADGCIQATVSNFGVQIQPDPKFRVPYFLGTLTDPFFEKKWVTELLATKQLPENFRKRYGTNNTAELVKLMEQDEYMDFPVTCGSTIDIYETHDGYPVVTFSRYSSTM